MFIAGTYLGPLRRDDPPRDHRPLREEAERVIAEEGWSKASLSKMHKIDSFIRESQRMSGIPACTHAAYQLNTLY